MHNSIISKHKGICFSIYFMQKSLQEHIPYKKRGDQLSSSDYSNRSGGELTNYTEIMISTNNKEVPFISIFKPDSTKEHSRVQGAVFLHKSIRQFQRERMRLSLRKMIDARQRHIKVLEKCKGLFQMGQRKDRVLMTYAFAKMRQNKMRSKALCLAAKTLDRFSANFKVYNKKYAFYILQIHSYKVCITEVKDKDELCRKITNLQSQIHSIKLSAYSAHFLSKIKAYQRYIGSFIQNIRKNDLQGVLKQQIKRFQLQRLKITPKPRENFENELIIIIITNLIKGYESKMAQFTSKIEQMQGKIAYSQKDQQMQALRHQIQILNKDIHKINHLVGEADSFYAQIKRAKTKSLNHQSLNALTSIISTRIKTLQSYMTEQSERTINKMVKSEVILCQVINRLCQQSISRQAHKKQVRFKVQQGEQARSARFFNALQRTLISAQVPSQTIGQVLHFRQHFLQIDSKCEQQMHQRMASQSLIEEMTIISSQLKHQNKNLKLFQQNYYDLLSQKKEKDEMIDTLTNSIKDKDKHIQSLYEKVKQLTPTGMNGASREKLDSGYKSKPRTVQLMKQLLNLKISLQSQVMMHQKQVRQMKNEIFQYQTLINQLKSEILQKDHKIAKEKQEYKKLAQKIAYMSKSDMNQHSPFILYKPQNIQSELYRVKQENETNKTQIRQARQNNQMLTKQINQIKRQFYKREKALKKNISQKDESLSRFQMGSNQSSNNFTPKFHLSQSLNHKQSQIIARDQEIKLLATKVKSLQALLSDITSQYHDLQQQFQHLNAFPLTPDLSEVKCTEKKMPETIREATNYAIMDDKVLSQKLKELMASSESLAYSIDFAKQGLEQHISEKRNESILEKDSLIHLVFSILLDVQKVGPDTQQASKIWKQMCQIKAKTPSKDFIAKLQRFSKEIIARSIKK